MTSRTTAPQTETGSPSGVVDPIKAVPVRKYGQWAIAAIVALYAAQLIVSVARNETLEYGSTDGMVRSVDAAMRGGMAPYRKFQVRRSCQ